MLDRILAACPAGPDAREQQPVTRTRTAMSHVTDGAVRGRRGAHMLQRPQAVVGNCALCVKPSVWENRIDGDLNVINESALRTRYSYWDLGRVECWWQQGAALVHQRGPCRAHQASTSAHKYEVHIASSHSRPRTFHLQDSESGVSPLPSQFPISVSVCVLLKTYHLELVQNRESSYGETQPPRLPHTTSRCQSGTVPTH